MSRSDLVLCVGEPLVVFSPPPGESLDGSETLFVSVGGAEANVAIHLARLGVGVRFAGRIGDDPFGARVRAALAAEGVDVEAVETDPDRPTGLYAKQPTTNGTVAHYYRRGSATSAWEHIDERALTGVNRVHVTGILASLGPGCLAIVGDLLARDIPVSFDVNYRPALWEGADAPAALLDLASQADTVFVGLDEAHELWDCTDADHVRTLLPRVELVVKDAGRPAVAFAGETRIGVAALPVVVVEPVGAGDAFAAGYLAARHSGGDIARALRTGHAVAAGTLETYGDQGESVAPDRLAAAVTGEGWPDDAG